MRYKVKVGVITKPSDEADAVKLANSVFHDVWYRLVAKQGANPEVRVLDMTDSGFFPVTLTYFAEADSEQDACEPVYNFSLAWKNTHGAQPVIDVEKMGDVVAAKQQTSDDYFKEQEAAFSQIAEGEVATIGGGDEGAEISEKDKLQAILFDRGVKFHHKAGIEKLRELESQTR